MPKLQTGNNLAKNIPISQIRITKNVRQDFDTDKIQQLAESIQKNGLLNPITVKFYGSDEYGNETYELIAGERRLRAHQYLCEQGQNYSMITACIKTGNKQLMQLIENIQRENLTSEETEAALLEMINQGLTHTEISSQISKPLTWISDTLAGAKIRQVATNAGIETKEIKTKTLSQFRTIPKDEIPAKIEELKTAGGTFRAATNILHTQPAKPPKPMMIKISSVIEELQNYKKLNPHKTEACDTCDDLIQIFEAYQHQ